MVTPGMCALLIDCDAATGRATGVQRLMLANSSAADTLHPFAIRETILIAG